MANESYMKLDSEEFIRREVNQYPKNILVELLVKGVLENRSLSDTLTRILLEYEDGRDLRSGIKEGKALMFKLTLDPKWKDLC